MAVKLSLCMIVKNEEAVLKRCLSSVPFVDEIVVADTGSTDGTKEIAKEFTDAVYDYAWTDDFAAARNFSFSKATGNQVYLKPENMQVTGAYKLRGAYFKISTLTDEEKAGAPASFVTIPAKGLGKDAPAYSFRMQVSPYDCMGCGVCLTACPAMGALEMVPFEEEKAQQSNFDNYAMDEKLLKKDIISDKSVKTAQFAKPYFQFSAACAGCAETTYIKLVSQLVQVGLVALTSGGVQQAAAQLHQGGFARAV